MSNYTLGPWVVGLGIRAIHVVIGKIKVVLGVDEEAEANAHLISAAPDMLDLLVDCEWIWESLPEECYQSAEERCPKCQKPRAEGHAPDCKWDAAIKKARGE